ncbi:MAG: flavodoxin [Oscillospiraceae bacterium]|jgi:flavodoxin|nr:flavodoxin [Oscillospiraceae bacterium]
MNKQKTLVVYFSATGITAKAAATLAEAADADLFAIQPAKPYTAADLDWTDKKSRSTLEMNDPHSRPAVANRVENMKDYTTVFVGFPIWWGDMPMILYTFFDRYELSGKKLVPFVTSGGSGFSNTRSTIADLEPNAAVLDGLALGSSEAKAPASAVKKWLTSIGLAS